MDFKSAFIIAKEQKMSMVLYDNSGKEILFEPTDQIPQELKQKSCWGVRYKAA